ncbi:hypothetical protein [Sulfurimonas sp. NW9]|uniref:hypothetical protein n=1 Tax=Sulfurimonas sp. NW9 TaxID=2922728 RepID=UPI003DA93070
MDTFVKMFQKVRSKNHIIVGFCDYDKKKYDAFKKFYDGDLSFSLFKTQQIASLFADGFKEKNKNILPLQ